MQNGLPALEDTIKFEVVEVKIETAEAESGLLGIEQTSWRPPIKVEQTDELVLNRIKREYIVEDWNNELEKQNTKVELEEIEECEELKIEVEEVIIKEEHDDESNEEKAVNRSLEISRPQNQHLKTGDKLTCTHCNSAFNRKLNLDDHIVRKHPHLIASVSSKIRECTQCTYKTTVKGSFDKHMLKHSVAVDNHKLSLCVHCDAMFINRIDLDDHIIRKHPDSIALISRKIHQCRYCTYKTTKKGHLTSHMFKHPETADSCKRITCAHCDAVYKRKEELDEHTIKKHPDAIASVSSKIHECPHCTYKTIIKRSFAGHMLEHPETDCNTSCVHCNATFKQKASLDDHIICKHPDFIASVSSKIHECTCCPYKTVVKSNLAHHMLKHPETADSHKFIVCVHCDTAYSNKKNLDEHIIRIHPDCIASISSKVHQCSYCSFKTTVKGNFTSHMLNHSETADSFKLNRTCTDCNTTFKSKTYLDEHIIRKHPDFMASVTSKIHECSHCMYQTTIKRKLAIHLLEHG